MLVGSGIIINLSQMFISNLKYYYCHINIADDIFIVDRIRRERRYAKIVYLKNFMQQSRYVRYKPSFHVINSILITIGKHLHYSYPVALLSLNCKIIWLGILLENISRLLLGYLINLWKLCRYSQMQLSIRSVSKYLQR